MREFEWGDITLTSTVEMLPTTFHWLSITAKEVRPSLFINLRASMRGLSPLVDLGNRQLSGHFSRLKTHNLLYGDKVLRRSNSKFPKSLWI